MLAQSYKGNIKIIVVDGLSTDKTRDLVQLYSEKHPTIVLLINEGIYQSAGRNLGFEYATTELIAYIDAHSFADKYWLENLYLAYSKIKESDDKIIGIGSIYRNAENSDFSIAAEIAFESIVIGTTKSSFLRKNQISKVDNAYACLYDRAKLLSAGIYNPDLPVGEDMELNNRLTLKLGYHLYVNPEALTYYYRRNSIVGIFEQQLNYGFWRLKVLKLLGLFNSKVIAPAIFIVLLLLLFFLGLFSKFIFFIFLLILASYLTVIIGATIYYSLKQRKFHYWLLLIFPAIHFGYGLGVMKGLFKIKR